MTLPSLNTYGSFQREVGYAGELVDQNVFESESMMNDQAVAIQYGCAVARSAADNTCKAPAADADKIIGIALRHAIKAVLGASVGGTNTVQYDKNDEVPVGRRGYIYAVAAENATRGDNVISITAQNGALGSVTGGAAGAGRVALDGANGNCKAVWETTTAAGSVGIVRVSY